MKTSDDRDNRWAFGEVGVHGFFLQPPPCAPHLAESSSIISIIWCFHPFFLSFAVEALVSVLIAIPTPATLCMKGWKCKEVIFRESIEWWKLNNQRNRNHTILRLVQSLVAASGPIEWVLDCSVFRSKEKLQNCDFPWPCSTGAFSWTKRREIKATAFEATHLVVGVVNEPIWRSLVPTQRSQFVPEDRNWFTWCEVLVKVSFGERGSTFGIFQKNLRENAYYEEVDLSRNEEGQYAFRSRSLDWAAASTSGVRP